MESASDYLVRLYKEIKPEHVVEIGADTPMKLAAHTTANAITPSIQRVSIVALKEDNAFRRGWWRMHPNMGVPVVRVDGDARKLTSLIGRADVVLSHDVLYSCDNGRDLQRWADYQHGEVDLSEDEIRSLIAGFTEAERIVIDEAHKVARTGHVIWFMNNGTEEGLKKYFREVAGRYNGRVVDETKVVGLRGEDEDYVLNVSHSKP